MRQAFGILDADGSGEVQIDDMMELYDLAGDANVQEGKVDESEALQAFLAVFDQSKDGIVTWDEFLSYYKDISISIDSDEYFELMIR